MDYLYYQFDWLIEPDKVNYLHFTLFENQLSLTYSLVLPEEFLSVSIEGYRFLHLIIQVLSENDLNTFLNISRRTGQIEFINCSVCDESLYKAAFDPIQLLPSLIGETFVEIWGAGDENQKLDDQRKNSQ